MAINTSLLVSAAVLQDYFVDKDTGLPLAAGQIFLYEDNQRSILKNWYEQIGSFPNYTYVPLPNPMTLSAVGTIQDVNGNDVIPFFYPYVENVEVPTPQAYFIQVFDSNGELQFTRSNFPFVPPVPAAADVDTNENLVLNSVFWRNIADNTTAITGGAGSILTNTITINGVNLNYAAIAPSQHDGFTMPDIGYYRNSIDGAETIRFTNFATNYPDNILVGDPTPQYYLEINCATVGTETVKYVQIPLDSSIYDLSGFITTDFTVQALYLNSVTAPTITMGIFQFLGTGVTSPTVTPVSQTLTQAWTKYEVNLPIPSVQTPSPVTPSAAGDHGLYLQIGIPVGEFTIRLAMPAFYLSNTSATNSFQTNDQANVIISSPRTGDIRVSNNAFFPYGWVPMNNGVISLNTPTNLQICRSNKDTFQLFSLFWNLSKAYDSGSNFNPICQMYTNTGVATNYGASPFADFVTNNNALQLTQMMGKVLLGTVPVSVLTTPYKTTCTFTNSGGLAVVAANNLNFFEGMPITFTNVGGALPSGLVANAVYYAANFGGTACNVATSFANAMAKVVLPFVNAGTGTTTIISAVTGTNEGEYTHTQLPQEIATHAHGALGTPSGGTPSFVVDHTVGTISLGGGGTSTSGQTTTANAGLSTPFNVTQPGLFHNIFVKL